MPRFLVIAHLHYNTNDYFFFFFSLTCSILDLWYYSKIIEIFPKNPYEKNSINMSHKPQPTSEL